MESFVIVAAITEAGVIDAISQIFIRATLGGNITPVGASANITGIGILRKNGHEVSTMDFIKISVPFTLASVITGYILIWLIWS